MQVNIHYGDLWNFHNKDESKYIVVPSNTTVRKDGSAVMGRGIAAQAAKKFQKLPRAYGTRLRKQKTIDGFFVFKKRAIIMLPVKHDWKDNANVELIKDGLDLLSQVLNVDKSIKSVGIPMLGCGFGGLAYEFVLPMLFSFIRKNHAHINRIHIVIPPNKLYSIEEYRESMLPAIGGKKDKRVSLSGSFSDVEI